MLRRLAHFVVYRFSLFCFVCSLEIYGEVNLNLKGGIMLKRHSYAEDLYRDVFWLWLGILLLPFDLIHQVIIDKENDK